MSEIPRGRHSLALGGAIFGSAALASAAAAAAASVILARRILTPDHRRAEDVDIFAVDDHSVTLRETPQTRVPGRYGLWLDRGQGHARIGDPIEGEGVRDVVRRELIEVDRGILRPGKARWNSYYFGAAPDRSLGLRTLHITVPSDVGELPAWRVPPEGIDDGAPHPWAILVHGRGAPREECVRGIPVLHGLGYTCLVPAYRNDQGAPRGVDGRYHMGLSEWRDVDASITYARANGATKIVLMGWSMGGAIVLQTAHQSPQADHIDALILDAPAIDWRDIFAHQARVNHIPPAVRDGASAIFDHTHGWRVLGSHMPVPLDDLDWVRRAADLAHRTLLIHSVDDDFVPSGPSLALATARPDVVTWEPFATARHCQEWNVDWQRWEAAVRRFLTS